MADYLFGWLPPRDVLAILLFGISLVIFLELERTKHAGKLKLWLLGISFWLVGMVFDALRHVEGWGILRIVEHSFQLGGSVIIAYAAYEANKRLKVSRAEGA